MRGIARRARARFRKRRGASLGLVGKVGVGVAAGAPIVASALDGATGAIGTMRAHNVGLMGTASIGFWRFLNGLSSGFGMGEIIKTIPVTSTDGTAFHAPIGTGIPSGAWFKTSVIGGTLVAWDILVSWTTRKFAKVSSGVRFMGTKLTGGR